MPRSTASSQHMRELGDRVQRDGHAFTPASETALLLEQYSPLTDWTAFASSWNELSPDIYLASTGRQRRRRHAVFSTTPDGAISLAPSQPHFQSSDYNPLQGDIQRWFDPIVPQVLDGDCLRAVLRFGMDFFNRISPKPRAWHVEAHQFRIEANAGQIGEPTPEGVHRDGVDYVLVLLVARLNVSSGTTTVHDALRTQLGSFTLTRTLDVVLLDDRRMFHGVTPVSPVDPTLPAYRDVLVVTYRASNSG